MEASSIRSLTLRRLFPCILALAAATGCSKAPVPVILISLDTLRADHLTPYGYGRDTSPFLDRLVREEAVLFENAFAQAPFTLPSHMSLLTSLYPDVHGMLKPKVADPGGGKRLTPRLADKVITLAECLRKGGYATTAFTDGGMVSANFGYDQGFDAYDDRREGPQEKNGFRRIAPRVHAWLDRTATAPFFLFLHTFDTHAPYRAPPEYGECFRDAPPGRPLPHEDLSMPSLLAYHRCSDFDRFDSVQDVVDAYDACIRHVDDRLQDLATHLKRLDLWEDALVVITSNHGESFLENGITIGHSIFLHNEEVRIPLIVKFPRGLHAGRRVDHPVESVDVMPTILSTLDLPVPEDAQGQDLLAGLDSDRWAKDYAYGVSPLTGGNRYLFRQGVKLVEGNVDPDGDLMIRILKPKDPTLPHGPLGSGSKRKPEDYYDLDADPLGLKELFCRGDRLFDLNREALEWRAPELRDPRLFEAYREGLSRLARDHANRSRHFQPLLYGESPSEENAEALAALGYAGLFDADPKRRDLTEVKKFPAPPLTDRTRLVEGDRAMVELHEILMASTPPQADRVAELHRAAYAAYTSFRAGHPDKKSWTDWRLEFLAATLILIEKRDGDAIPSVEPESDDVP